VGFDLEIWGPRKGKRGNSSLLWEPVGKDSDHGVGDKTFLKLTTFYYCSNQFFRLGCSAKNMTYFCFRLLPPHYLTVHRDNMTSIAMLRWTCGGWSESPISTFTGWIPEVEHESLGSVMESSFIQYYARINVASVCCEYTGPRGMHGPSGFAGFRGRGGATGATGATGAEIQVAKRRTARAAGCPGML